MSERRLERWRHKPPSRALWRSIGLFAAVVTAIGFLGGDRAAIPYGIGLLVAALAAIPLLVVTALLFLTDGRDDRREYALRTALILLLVAVKVAWDYAS